MPWSGSGLILEARRIVEHDLNLILIKIQSAKNWGNWCKVDGIIEIKNDLSQINNPKKWDDIIFPINKIRDKVAHDDYYDPSKEEMDKVRKKAQEFHDWLISTARRYHRESKDFTFIQSFYHTLNGYKDRAKMILDEYGEHPPSVAEDEYGILFRKIHYKNLPDIIKHIEKRLMEINKSENVVKDDIDLLGDIPLDEDIVNSYCQGKPLMDKSNNFDKNGEGYNRKFAGQFRIEFRHVLGTDEEFSRDIYLPSVPPVNHFIRHVDYGNDCENRVYAREPDEI